MLGNFLVLAGWPADVLILAKIKKLTDVLMLANDPILTHFLILFNVQMIDNVLGLAYVLMLFNVIMLTSASYMSSWSFNAIYVLLLKLMFKFHLMLARYWKYSLMLANGLFLGKAALLV